MVFRKPYAFLIKYFRLINFILVVLLLYLAYKFHGISNVFSQIYNSKVIDYASLNLNYAGYGLFVFIFLILSLLVIIVLLLKNKKKPFKDYLFSIIYIIILLLYLIFVTGVFNGLEESVYEMTTLKLYSDISFLIIIPVYYFILKFSLITFGFSLTKFNFTKDIIELKQEEKDNEEVEIIFNKNTYKYKRRFNRTVRELKYYFLENKLFIIIVLSVILLLLIGLYGFSFFKSDKVKMNKSFVAGTLTYKVTNVYETKYDLNYKVIKNDKKYVIASINVRNNLNSPQNIDFKKIRLVYKNDYVYANNYFNKHFYDLGTPYNNEFLEQGINKEYIFIFEVPVNYKSNNYKIKIYDKVSYVDDELIGLYKTVPVKSVNIDKKRDTKELKINESVNIGSNFGNTNISLNAYTISTNYLYKNNGKTTILRDNDINKNLLIIDYKINIDKNTYFKDIEEFFNKFCKIEYIYNGKEVNIDNLKIIGNVDNKILISVPYDIQKSESINVSFDFRNVNIKYKLK